MSARKRAAPEWDDEYDDEVNGDWDDAYHEADEDLDGEVEEEYDYGWDDFRPSLPRHVEGGIKSRSGPRGRFGESWWAQKWLAALDSFGWSNRLQRGRSYARGGQVLSIRIGKGEVSARVQGSRPKPYDVTIGLKPLSDAAWDKAIAAMATQSGFAARLLAGEMPQNIEDAFAAARVSLLPATRTALNASCTCPDPANPCKHIAAVHYILAEQFDADPFIIFQLRGRTREQVLTALRAMRGPEPATAKALPAPEEAEPLAAHLDNFWAMRASVDALRFNVAAPPIEAALLKRLGQPPFWRGPHDFAQTMTAVYAAVTAAAVEVA
jgi:uncharacterized Zn finger protein